MAVQQIEPVELLFYPTEVIKPDDNETVALSVVIPLFNEEDNIKPLYDELNPVLESLGLRYEVILIDDGSSDHSFDRVKAVHDNDSRWCAIRFRRNFGQTAGIMAGFERARGAVIFTMDADLQNDPRDIPKLLSKMNEDYDIVSGWRMNRKEPFVSRRLPSMLANYLISHTTGIVLHDYGCTLKAYRSEIAKDIKLYGELHRFIPAVASGMGVRVAEVPVNDRARRFGHSKYGISRTFKVIVDLITVMFFLSFSTKPLHMFGIFGLVLMSLGGAIGAYLTYVRLILGEGISDRPLLLLAMLLIILGIQLIGIGLVAEFVMRTYHEPRGKKTYFVRERLDNS